MSTDYYYKYDEKEQPINRDYTYTISVTSTDITETTDYYTEFTKPNFSNAPPLPTSVALSWKNLTYEIMDPKTKSRKKVVQNVSGIVNPGELLAVMGPSGAGKSTFLDLLAGRKDPKYVSGSVYLNGKPSNVKYVSTYVMQDDALMGVLTVRENIQFAADLCFTGNYSKADKEARVNNIIQEFGLEKIADNKIGTVFVRGISGGEKRRCVIASQVLTFPKVIFLDEPTTGLDSAAAYNVMNAIVQMAKRHQLTVVASIHQPSTETYALFNKLLLLGHGKTLYFGAREKALPYFEKLGYPCPSHSNPADHFLKLVNSDFMKDITEAEQHITTFSMAFQKSVYIRETNKEIDGGIDKANRGFAGVISEKTTQRYARGFLAQTFILMGRSLKNATRNILMFWIRVAMYVCLALLMGAAWWQVGYEQKNIQDRFAALFFSVAFLVLMSVAGIPGFLEERLVFQRERANGFYSVGPYVLANTLIAIPFLIIITLSFSVFAYPMIGLHPGFENALNFAIFLFLALFVAESMVAFISAAMPIFVASLAITAFANGFFMIVEGFFVRKDSLPGYLKWGYYVDYQKYSFEAIVKNDFIGLTFDCDPDPSGLANCRCNYGINSTDTCKFTGKDVLDSFGYTDIDLYKWAIALGGLALAFRFGFYLSLHFRKGHH